MIHEFGHTLGLVHEVPTPSVMAESWNYTNIGPNDIDYVPGGVSHPLRRAR